MISIQISSITLKKQPIRDKVAYLEHVSSHPKFPEIKNPVFP